MLNILVVCTGNSCRSIIGEAVFNHLGGDRLQAFSAGTHPLGQINSGALELLRRKHLPTDSCQSQSLHEFAEQPLDIVITVCDSAANECPAHFGGAASVHWGLQDPTHTEGAARIAAFDHLYDIFTQRIVAMLALPLETMTAAQTTTELNILAKLHG